MSSPWKALFFLPSFSSLWYLFFFLTFKLKGKPISVATQVGSPSLGSGRGPRFPRIWNHHICCIWCAMYV